MHVVLIMTHICHSSLQLPQIKTQWQPRAGGGVAEEPSHDAHKGRHTGGMEGVVGFCDAFGADIYGDWWCLLATCAATGALGWFIFLTFSLLPLYDITPVRHLLDRTELTAYAATYLVFKKASAFVCVVALVDLPPCLFVYPKGRRAEIDDRYI